MVSRSTTKKNTMDRWHAALVRAIAEGVEVRQLAGCGGWIATSGSDPETAYEVTPWECECHAGQFVDPVCKHRAALLWKLGRLYFEPDPSRPGLCPTCNGVGAHPVIHLGDRLADASQVVCQDCHGSGHARDQAA